MGHVMNTKIGSWNIGCEEVKGTHGLGDLSNNGKGFADIRAEHKLVTGVSVFPNKRADKATMGFD